MVFINAEKSKNGLRQGRDGKSPGNGAGKILERKKEASGFTQGTGRHEKESTLGDQKPFRPSSIIIVRCSAGGNPLRQFWKCRFSQARRAAIQLRQPWKPSETLGNPRKPFQKEPGTPPRKLTLYPQWAPLKTHKKRACVAGGNGEGEEGGGQPQKGGGWESRRGTK